MTYAIENYGQTIGLTEQRFAECLISETTAGRRLRDTLRHVRWPDGLLLWDGISPLSIRPATAAEEIDVGLIRAKSRLTRR